MNVTCRLRRKFKIYKILLLITVLYCVYLFCKVMLLNHDDEPCLYKDPIDVVYTWVNGSDPRFLQDLNVYLNKSDAGYPKFYQKRYDDKYELRFSLRSIEKYAPWINHVYIVTNGQIPYWLNLDYEKVTVITHEQIFKSSFNLPTFSSPAIESNLHRIPGLSKRFIYFNDDVFLGKPMFLEDFYSPNKGFLIYLSYPLPMCSSNCSWLFVGDGQCDSVCYTKKCQLDGGDCDKAKSEKPNDDISFEKLDAQLKKTLMNDHIENIRSNLMRSYKGIKKINQATTKEIPLNKNIATTDVKINATFIDLKKDNSTIYNLRDIVKRAKREAVGKMIAVHNKRIIFANKIRRRYSTFYKKYRTLVDPYSESLQYTHRLYNLKYGFKTRKVPSHAPIMIDIDIMEDLQNVFKKEMFMTELNRIRSINDLQFAFSYYYFIINEMKNHSVEDVFDMFDTDASGTWSDREIRTLLSKIYELPLSFAIVDHFETMLLNCSEKISLGNILTPMYERYIDSRLTTISKELIMKCNIIANILTQRFGESQKYEYEVISHADNDYVSFIMLHSNVTEVVTHLDDIRNNPKKFICLNDDLDYTKTGENELVKSILYDFYLSLFPNPSKFELPDDYRNKYMYMDELNSWKDHHFKINVFIICAILILCYVTLLNTCKKLLCNYINKLFC